MREIKFRAWDKENGEMIYSDKEYMDYQFVVNDNTVVCINVEDYDDSFGYTQTSSCELDNIMQYTGLKDKNGKEIYEGDIVKIDGEFRDKEIGKVEWIDNQANYLITWIKIGCKCAETFGNIEYTRNQFEVIGNIHENPELLEAQDV